MNDEAPRDAQLVEAAVAGDRNAFGDLVVRYQDRLFNTLVHTMGSHHDAADVLQDAFVQAFTKLETFRGASQFYTWLYRIAMNKAYSSRRGAKTTTSIEVAKETVGNEPLDCGQGPEESVLARERVEHVQAALAKLSVQHRKVMVLREMEGFSYESIAEILELPINTVRSQLFRAREQVKKILAGVWEEEAGTAG